MPLSLHKNYRKGQVAEWLKAHAWKVCIRQKRIEGSNPSLSAIYDLWGLHKQGFQALSGAIR